MCGSDDSLWHGSKLGYQIDRVPAYFIRQDWSVSISFVPTSATVYFDNNLCNKADGKCNDPSMILKFSKVLILLVWTQFKPI